jgi:hypothetical protein
VYDIGAGFLHGLAVEDWGCGLGWYRTVHTGPYLGIDGTASRWADVVDDLATRRSSTPGLWLRGVLEHNVEWRAILANAVASATERLAISVFTPEGDGRQIGWTEQLGVPDLALPWQDIDDALTAAGWTFERRTVPAPASYYRFEEMWLAQRAPSVPRPQPDRVKARPRRPR